MTEMNLKGKTVLITGSTRAGIGSAAAFALASSGANIVLNYGTGSRDSAAKKRASCMTKKIKQFNKNVITLVGDIKKEKEVKDLFEAAEKKFGSVDILVNNAGGTWIEQDFAEIKTNHWNQMIRAEIDGTFFCIREALPAMRRNGWGRIINICLDEESIAFALNAEGHVLEKYPYDFALTKNVKAEMSRKIALAEFKYGITCNNILPGIIEEMNNEQTLNIIQNKISQSVFFNPTDVAATVNYLCGNEARGITGSDIRFPGNLYNRL